MDTLFEMPEVSNGSGKSNEWYTLAKHIKAARNVMGSIELDPASCAAANAVVQAKRYYTQEQDGLAQDWTCTSMWLNPPFGNAPNGKSNMMLWSARLIEEYACGRVSQAILLSMSNTEASWFAPLWTYPICFPCPRVLFHRPDGKLDHHIQGTCFVYLGPNEAKFIDIFSQFGTIAKRVSPPPAKPAMLSLWNDVTTLANEIAAWEVPGEQREESVG
jgi:hypothetical protein